MSWQRIRGHDSLIQAFDQAVRRGRLAHAYLFVGPAGVGKRLFAAELAKALLCEKRTISPAEPDALATVGPNLRLDACDHCPSCIQIDADTHPDVFAVARPPD